MPNGARASLASGVTKALVSPRGRRRRVSHRAFWGQVSRCSSPTSWGARSGGESAKSGCSSAGRSTGWTRRGRRKCRQPLAPHSPSEPRGHRRCPHGWVAGAASPQELPPGLCRNGIWGFPDLAALPRLSENQCDCGVGKTQALTEDGGRGFCRSRRALLIFGKCVLFPPVGSSLC